MEPVKIYTAGPICAKLCDRSCSLQEANEIDTMSGVYVGCFKIEIVGQPLIAR